MSAPAVIISSWLHKFFPTVEKDLSINQLNALQAQVLLSALSPAWVWAGRLLWYMQRKLTLCLATVHCSSLRAFCSARLIAAPDDSFNFGQDTACRGTGLTTCSTGPGRPNSCRAALAALQGTCSHPPCC